MRSKSRPRDPSKSKTLFLRQITFCFNVSHIHELSQKCHNSQIIQNVSKNLKLPQTCDSCIALLYHKMHTDLIYLADFLNHPVCKKADKYHL